MPNHVTNKLKIIGSKERINEIKEYLKIEYDDCTVGMDFNKIIPMPKSLNMVSGSIEDIALSVYILENPESKYVIKKSKDFFINRSKEEIYDYLKHNSEKTYNELLEIGKKYYENIKEYGYSTWHDWCRKYWETKWNAYKCDLEDTEDTIYFLTAWSGVPNLIEIISVKYPEVEFEYYYADENFGHNVGAYKFKNGDKEKRIIEGGTKEAYLLAAEIRQETLEENCINPKTFEYDESLEEEI